MTIKRFRFILISILTIISFGCEYNLDQEHFIEVAKPSETHQFELSLIPENDTILVVDVTELNFDLKTFGLNVLKGVIKLNDKEWIINSSTEKIIIDPEDFSAGIDTLKATFYTNSGSGSIADKVGAEGYSIEKKWLLMHDGRTAPAITPTNSVSEDGFLKLSWSKCNQINFQSYVIKKGFQVIKVITDPNCTSYIDSTFVGGNYSYSIDTKVFTRNKTTFGEKLLINETYPHILFEKIGTDKLRIYWNKSKYKCKYELAYGKGQSEYTHVYFDSSSDTEYVISTPAIGVQLSFILFSNPVHLEYSINYAQMDFKNFINGSFLSSNFPEVGYNRLENIFYSNNDQHINCYDIKTMTIKKTIDLGEWVTRYSCATNSSKLAVYTYQNIYVFDDENLQNPTKFTLSGVNSVSHFILTDNNYVAISYPSKYILYNVQEKKAVATLNIENYPSYNQHPKITTSQDAKYVCISSSNGIKLYKIENSTFTEVYSDARSYSSVYFNPLNPTELLLSITNDKSIEIRNIPDFSLKKTYYLPANYQIENIDTESGYLLLHNSSRLLVFDIQSGNIKLGINCTSSNYQLFGNVIFSNDGYYLDISKDLNK